jgi:hypothetical protein
MVRMEGDEVRFVFVEPDGHAAQVFDSDGTELSFDVAGVYGLPVASRGPAWPIDGQHGAEPDRFMDVVHRQRRHHLHRDGMWMQPEPLQSCSRPHGSVAVPSGRRARRV